MVGNGPDEEMLKNMASTDPNIRFVGFMNQSQMPMIYRSADVFVLPSVSETWGLGINEAMNCGLAIIASDKVGSAVDLITNNGYIFEAVNSDMLSVKMKELIQHNNILMEMKEKSIINIKDWSINKLVVNFENALLKNV
jgi:glycosyltransferase involved in cell wall biosynthesis